MILLDLLYPPVCRHCGDRVDRNTPLCPACLEDFHLIPKEGRCQKCFVEIPLAFGTCKGCRTLSHPFVRLAGCFEGMGPASSSVQALKGGRFCVAKDIAAFFVLQQEQLGFPPFDLVTMVPSRFFQKGYPIGKEVGKMLGAPFRPLLKRRFVLEPIFSLKKRGAVINQRVLLLDLVLKDRGEIRAAGFALKRGLAEEVWGLCFTVD